jgi:PhoPQ-activated pathogenicity-related protein
MSKVTISYLFFFVCSLKYTKPQQAGSNAMTAIQLFAQSFPHVPPIRDFVVCGASKRGWNTWTVAAVDARVRAAIPIVMPIPNMIQVRKQKETNCWFC